MAQVPYTAILNQNTGILTVYRIKQNKLESVATATVFSGNTESIEYSWCDVKVATDNTIYVLVGYKWAPTSKTHLKVYILTANALTLDAVYEIGSALSTGIGRWNPATFDFAFTGVGYIYVYNYDPNSSTITSKASVSFSGFDIRHIAWSSNGTRLVGSYPTSSLKSFAWDGENLIQKCSVSLSSSTYCYFPYFVPGSNTDIVFLCKNTATPPAYSLQRYAFNEETGNSWTQVYYLAGQDSGAGYVPIHLAFDGDNQTLYLLLYPYSDTYTHAVTTECVHVYRYDSSGFSFVRDFHGGGFSDTYSWGSASSGGLLATQKYQSYSSMLFAVSDALVARFSDLMEKIHYISPNQFQRIIPKHSDYQQSLSYTLIGLDEKMFVGADDADTPMYVFRGVPGDDNSWTKYTLLAGTGKARVHRNLGGAVFASTWAAGTGKVYIWDTENEEWDDVGLTTSNEISSVCGNSAESLWLSVGGVIYYWDGSSLTAQTSYISSYRLNYWSDSLIIACPTSSSYYIYRWNGSAWSKIDIVPSSSELSRNAHTTDGTNWWIALRRTSTPKYLSLHRSTNGGTSWTEYRITNYYNFRDYPNVASNSIYNVFSTDADTCYFSYIGGLYVFDRTANTVTPVYTFPQAVLFSPQGTMLDTINTDVGYIGQYSLSSWVSRPESGGANINQDGRVLAEYQFSIGGLKK